MCMPIEIENGVVFIWSFESLSTPFEVRPIFGIHRQRLFSSPNPIRVRKIQKHRKPESHRKAVTKRKSSTQKGSTSLTLIKKLILFVVSQCNSLFRVSLCYLVWSNLSFELQPLQSTSANDHIFEFLRTFEIKSIFLESRDSTRKTLLNESVEDRGLVVR
jgi:hypothetical protein